MIKIMRSSQRSDEQPEAMFFEKGHWVVSGQQGRILCFAASLRHALERTAEYAMSGTPVAAVCHLPFHKINVFPKQIDRLLEIITIGGNLRGPSGRVSGCHFDGAVDLARGVLKS